METTGTERSYYSVSEVAALLGVSRVSIWRWISAGQLPATRLGHRTVRVRREDVDQIVRSHRHGRARNASASPETRLEFVSPTRWPETSTAALETPEHFVLFYDADRFLLDGIAEFLAPGLRAGGRSIVVATPSHRADLEERLQAAGVDVQRAREDGRYTALDAAETLDLFMLDGAPDPTLFLDVIGGLVRRAVGGSGTLRIFGEMVALLVADGNKAGALRLERMWNDLQATHPFGLLCGYPMQGFSGEDLASVLVDACSEHSYVVPSENYSALETGDDRLRQVVALQQKAASLEQEVAERRRAQEQLQHALAAERAARDEAEAALRIREEFLSVASHELRTPITVLSAQAQLLLRRVQRTGHLEPERVTQALHTMGSQADKLGRLVGQLLDISRLDSGKLQIEPETVDLTVLVRQIASAAGSLTSRHEISVCAPETLECEVDGLRLEQVLTNLLDNAVKYSPDGGLVEVVLDKPTPERIELSVRDHGLGIPHDKRGRIFERFFQAHESGYRSGMGLGLYVSRHIVELHGGQIRAEFPADGGTRMIVELPPVRATAGASVAAD